MPRNLFGIFFWSSPEVKLETTGSALTAIAFLPSFFLYLSCLFYFHCRRFRSGTVFYGFGSSCHRGRRRVCVPSCQLSTEFWLFVGIWHRLFTTKKEEEDRKKKKHEKFTRVSKAFRRNVVTQRLDEPKKTWVQLLLFSSYRKGYFRVRLELLFGCLCVCFAIISGSLRRRGCTRDRNENVKQMK